MATTIATTRATAIDRVFGTTELVEQILLELPIVDILVNATRVSRNFKNTIDGSIALQRALFFKPLDGPAIRLDIDPQARPSNVERFVEEHDRFKEVAVYRNPLQSGIREILISQSIDNEAHLEAVGCLRIAAIDRPDASWRRMLLCQPPLPHLNFQHAFRSDFGASLRTPDVRPGVGFLDDVLPHCSPVHSWSTWEARYMVDVYIAKDVKRVVWHTPGY